VLGVVSTATISGVTGLAVTFVSDETDAKVLNDVQDRFEVNITELPDEIDLCSYSKCNVHTLSLTVSVMYILSLSQ